MEIAMDDFGKADYAARRIRFCFQQIGFGRASHFLMFSNNLAHQKHPTPVVQELFYL
jgi:hypothetical protein